MSEVIHRTTSLEAQPRFMALLCIGLLFKLTGQQTFTIKELTEYNNEFDGLKVNHTPYEANIEDGTITVTLNRRDEDGQASV
jgi:hypothetical protein